MNDLVLFPENVDWFRDSLKLLGCIAFLAATSWAAAYWKNSRRIRTEQIRAELGKPKCSDAPSPAGKNRMGLSPTESRDEWPLEEKLEYRLTVFVKHRDSADFGDETVAIYTSKFPIPVPSVGDQVNVPGRSLHVLKRSFCFRGSGHGELTWCDVNLFCSDP